MYDHTTLDDDLAAAQEVMTEEFQDEYEPTVEEIRETALEQRRRQGARVVAVSIIDTYSTREGADEQDIMQNRVDVTMVHVGGKWLIDDVSVPVS